MPVKDIVKLKGDAVDVFREKGEMVPKRPRRRRVRKVYGPTLV